MSKKDLDSIMTEKKTKRLLKGITFDFEGAHLAYTSADQGGACSLMNDPLLLKSLQGDVTLSDHQKELLESMGHDISDLGKSLETDETNASSSDKNVEEDLIKNEKGNDTNMSKENVDASVARIEQLEKKLAQAEATNAVAGYKFEAEVNKGLVEAIAMLDETGQAAITKALDVLVSRTETAVTKAKESAKPEDTNPLAKALSEEKGHEEEVEIKEETVVEKALRLQEEAKNKEAK